MKPFAWKPLCPFLLLGSISLLGWGILLYTQVNLNGSGSLPYQAFFCVKGLPATRGDFVCITGHLTPYSGDAPLTKRVTGFPGETICIEKGPQQRDSSVLAADPALHGEASSGRIALGVHRRLRSLRQIPHADHP